MGLPIGVALLGLGVAFGLVSLGSHIVQIPDFATSMVAMIGLGVGIDYALFIVTRYREGLRLGLSVEESVVESIDTSGRAVLFAGMTVVISLMGLFLIGLTFVQGMALASVSGVIMMVLGALTLLPALLGLGRDEDRQHESRRADRRRHRHRRRIRRRHHRAVGAARGRSARGHRHHGPQRLRQVAAQARPAPRRAGEGAALLVPLEPVHPAPPVAERARAPSAC